MVINRTCVRSTEAKIQKRKEKKKKGERESKLRSSREMIRTRRGDWGAVERVKKQKNREN